MDRLCSDGPHLVAASLALHLQANKHIQIAWLEGDDTSHRDHMLHAQVMEMWTDLRQFDEAKRWAEEFARQRGDSAGVQELMGRQAAWSEETANYEAAAEMYIKVRDG